MFSFKMNYRMNNIIEYINPLITKRDYLQLVILLVHLLELKTLNLIARERKTRQPVDHFGSFGSSEASVSQR